jgi:SAM-dependent methyltransferase
VVQPAIDASEIKRQQRATWDAVSVGWEASMDAFEPFAATVTDRLLSLGDVRPGQSILDIGTGLGEPALSAARLVGPAGRVLGIDLSPAMVAAARRHSSGIRNVEYAVADIEMDELPAGPFDVALSRWGLMFAVDHAATFRSVARSLVPGGVLAAAVWGPPVSVPVMAFSYAVLSQRLHLPPPPPGTPGPFSMADRDALGAELAAAGFVDVVVEETTIPFRFSSTAEYVRFSRSVTPPVLLDLIQSRRGTADDLDVWTAIGEAAEQRYADGTQLLMPSTALCLRAVAPAQQA